METELDPKKKGEICQSENPVSQPPEPKSTTHHVLQTILGQIDKAQEEQCLEFTVSTEYAHVILESLYADANFERRGP